MRPELPVLIKARALIADSSKWGKGRRGRDRPFSTCCAAEAIEDVSLATINPMTRSPAYNAIRRVIGTQKIVEWNDAPERTHAEVLAAFDKAIEAAS